MQRHYPAFTTIHISLSVPLSVCLSLSTRSPNQDLEISVSTYLVLAQGTEFKRHVYLLFLLTTFCNTHYRILWCKILLMKAIGRQSSSGIPEFVMMGRALPRLCIIHATIIQKYLRLIV